MANLIAPRGFVPSRYLDSNPYTGSVNMYVVQQADTNQIGVGDAVKSFAGADATGIPAVTKALGTDIVRGVVVGVLVAAPQNPSLVGVNLDLTVQNIPAVKLRDYYIFVSDDLSILYEIQDDGLAVIPASASNKNATFTVVNPTFPQQNSATVLNTSSVAVTAGLNLRIMGLVQRADNAFGTNAKWIVKFNQHELMGGTPGV